MGSISKGLGLAVAIAVGVGLPSLSKAATYNFNQDACSAGLGCSGSALIATAVTQNVTGGVQVTIHLVDSANFSFYQAGNPPMSGWHASADPTSVTVPTISPIGGDAVTWSASGSFNSGAPGTMTGGLGYTKTNGTFIADIVYVLKGLTTASFNISDKGFYFAQDLCHTGEAANSCASGNTGFAGAILSAVPLPPAALLFGSGLIGLGLLGRRRRRKAGVAQA